MVVYADILVVLNFLVDYFLLSAVGWILKRKVKILRYILGALFGGIASLYIFFPVDSLIIDFLFKLIICALSSLVTFGFGDIKKYIKAAMCFFGVTCGYAGSMIAFWHIVRPGGMTVKNSVVYFNISPVVLVFSTVVAYLIFTILTAIFRQSASSAEKCSITLLASGKKAEFTALVDSGNSINDVFGKSEIIIADKSIAVSLFNDIDPNKNADLMSRYRVVPCSTVSGGDVLEGFRCDNAVIYAKGREILIEKPVLAVSKAPIKDGYEGIINPEILQ